MLAIVTVACMKRPPYETNTVFEFHLGIYMQFSGIVLKFAHNHSQECFGASRA